MTLSMSAVFCAGLISVSLLDILRMRLLNKGSCVDLKEKEMQSFRALCSEMLPFITPTKESQKK